MSDVIPRGTGAEPENDVCQQTKWMKRFPRSGGCGLVIHLENLLLVQQGKSSNGTPRVLGKEAAQETLGIENWRQTKRELAMTGKAWRSWPRIEMPGGLSEVA